MILRGGKRQRVLAIAQGEERGFLAAHELFNDDFRTGAPEAATEHHVDSVKRFFLGHRYDDAFAGGETVRLDHDRRALPADIGLCRRRIGEMRIGCGRNFVVAAKLLGEVLGTLQLARGFGRTECPEAGGIEIVDDAGGNRRIGTDHDKIHRVDFAEIDHRGMVGDIKRHTFGFPRDAGVARRAPKFRQQR